jgi:aryl-alcohol dehydrogenase-like predicted oxidoreductase
MGKPCAAPEYVRLACDASLQRLGTDRIDLYYQHIADPTVPIEETLGALDELVKAGKVLEIACSNFATALIDDATKAAASAGTARFVAVENETVGLAVRQPSRVLTRCSVSSRDASYSRVRFPRAR